MTITGASGSSIGLSLLGSFRLRVGAESIQTPTREAQRLLAVLAVHGRVAPRATIACTLWPEASELHAFASLRSALGRLDDLAHRALLVTDVDLALAPVVVVDLHEARALAARLLAPKAAPLAPDVTAHAIDLLSADLLSDWYDDWAVIESESWRQTRLRALHVLALRLVEARRFGDAMGAALAVLRSEPLRESARALVIRIHLAEGNQSEAFRAFDEYRALLARELDVEPTAALAALLPALT